MTAFARQAGTILVTLIGLLVLTFAIGRLMPVDPVRAIVGEEADPATYQQVYEELGMDQPVYVQFARYLGDTLRGDFGTSLRTGQPVAEDIAAVMPATIELATFAILLGAGLGIPLGVWAAVRKNRPTDHIVRVVTLLGHSMPIFWTGMIGLIVFYAWLGWVGGGGRVSDFYDGMVDPVTGFLLIDSALAGRLGRVLGRGQPPDPAGVDPRARLARLHHPDDAELHARPAEPGIHHHGAGEGAVVRADDLGARLRQHPGAARDHRGAGLRRAARRARC